MTASRASSPVVVVLSLLELVDVPPLQQQLLFLHDQQGPTDASGVRVDPDLSLSDVPDHRHLGTHTHTHIQRVNAVTLFQLVCLDERGIPDVWLEQQRRRRLQVYFSSYSTHNLIRFITGYSIVVHLKSKSKKYKKKIFMILSYIYLFLIHTLNRSLV